MYQPNHVYLVITGHTGISKGHRPRWNPNDLGNIMSAYPSAELAEEHANKLTELIAYNMTRMCGKDNVIVRDDGWNKAVITDTDDNFRIHWVNVERYEIHTEFKGV